MKKVSLELGGNAPFIVFDDADLDAAVAGALICKFRNSGQTCISANRILVQDGIYDEFVARFVDAASKLKVGNGLRAGDARRAADRAGRRSTRCERHVADAVERGGEVLLGGERPGRPRSASRPSSPASPRTLRCGARRRSAPSPASRASRPRRRRCASPTTRRTGSPPTSTRATSAASGASSEALEYGILGINTGLISTEVAPFGGIKESGIGREGSKYGIDEWLEIKYLCVGGV